MKKYILELTVEQFNELENNPAVMKEWLSYIENGVDIKMVNKDGIVCIEFKDHDNYIEVLKDKPKMTTFAKCSWWNLWC